MLAALAAEAVVTTRTVALWYKRGIRLISHSGELR